MLAGRDVWDGVKFLQKRMSFPILFLILIMLLVLLP